MRGALMALATKVAELAEEVTISGAKQQRGSGGEAEEAVEGAGVAAASSPAAPSSDARQLLQLLEEVQQLRAALEALSARADDSDARLAEGLADAAADRAALTSQLLAQVRWGAFMPWGGGGVLWGSLTLRRTVQHLLHSCVDASGRGQCQDALAGGGGLS